MHILILENPVDLVDVQSFDGIRIYFEMPRPVNMADGTVGTLHPPQKLDAR